MKRRLKLLTLIILSVLILTSCSSRPNYERQITKVINTKQQAIKDNNEEKYITTLNTNNEVYYYEQMMWIKDVIENDIEDYLLKIEDISLIDDETAIVKLLQTYNHNGTSYELQYNALFYKTDDGWKDSDLNFKIMETENFIVKYLNADEKRVQRLAKNAEDAYTKITEIYGEEPDSITEIKLFDDRESLRQFAAPSLAWQIGGWYDYPSSIRLYFGEVATRPYQHILEHELVHRITVEISKRNICSWFAEGLAVYYADFSNSGDPIESGFFDRNSLAVSITKLEETNLYEATDQFIISQFYYASGMIVKFMVEEYGHDKVKEIVAGLGEYPYNNNSEVAGEKESQEKLHQVIYKVLGKEMDELNSEWLEWIRG
ncbi:gluzincin family metallopeptidase [Alkaliphilus peptidifermentans]|uniref:hypothetical protein n=1 Tax=Alkaliphilus peptidifermentans TaxID=426129 RepID=UPI00115FCCFB|nr:hypothetical protein [Alkaliphilus peptidifermentans]